MAGSLTVSWCTMDRSRSCAVPARLARPNRAGHPMWHPSVSHGGRISFVARHCHEADTRLLRARPGCTAPRRRHDTVPQPPAPRATCPSDGHASEHRAGADARHRHASTRTSDLAGQPEAGVPPGDAPRAARLRTGHRQHDAAIRAALRRPDLRSCRHSMATAAALRAASLQVHPPSRVGPVNGGVLGIHSRSSACWATRRNTSSRRTSTRFPASHSACRPAGI